MYDMLEKMEHSGCFRKTRVYHHENGMVLLGVGQQHCYVAVIKQETPARQFIRERGRLDYISAEEFFDMACRYVRGEIEWREPVRNFSCKYNPNKSKGCTDKNCPKKLGGADYRELFMKACPFRKARTR